MPASPPAEAPRPTILIVEDDPAAARLAQTALRVTRAEVFVHGKAFGVLSEIASRRPSLVLLDVMMPGLDGPSLVELIRADAELARTRVVLWSALGGAELRARAAACGADGAIEKVAGPRVLVDQLSEWLMAWDSVALR